MSHKKFGPDRFSRFDVYWIQTNKQTNKQTDKPNLYIDIYASARTNLGNEGFFQQKSTSSKLESWMMSGHTIRKKTEITTLFLIQGASRHSLILTLNCCYFIKYFFLDFEKLKVLIGNLFQFWLSINPTLIMWGPPPKKHLPGWFSRFNVYLLVTNKHPPKKDKESKKIYRCRYIYKCVRTISILNPIV